MAEHCVLAVLSTSSWSPSIAMSLPTHFMFKILPLHLFLLVFLVQKTHSLPVAESQQLIPDGFSCTKDMPCQTGIYSTPSNSNLIKVDLIHVFCGQIYSYTRSSNTSGSGSVRVGGFHARPRDTDPASATTANSELVRAPPNVYGYSVYRNPYVYDSWRDMYVKKNTGSISSIWPTVLSMEDITEIITQLVYLCRYIYSVHAQSIVINTALFTGPPSTRVKVLHLTFVLSLA